LNFSKNSHNFFTNHSNSFAHSAKFNILRKVTLTNRNRMIVKNDLHEKVKLSLRILFHKYISFFYTVTMLRILQNVIIIVKRLVMMIFLSFLLQWNYRMSFNSQEAIMSHWSKIEHDGLPQILRRILIWIFPILITWLLYREVSFTEVTGCGV